MLVYDLGTPNPHSARCHGYREATTYTKLLVDGWRGCLSALDGVRERDWGIQYIGVPTPKEEKWCVRYQRAKVVDEGYMKWNRENKIKSGREQGG